MKRACLFEKLARRGLQWTFRVQLAPTPQKETTEEKQNKNILKKKKKLDPTLGHVFHLSFSSGTLKPLLLSISFRDRSVASLAHHIHRKHDISGRSNRSVYWINGCTDAL